MPKTALRPKSFGCVSFSLKAAKTSGLSHVRFITCHNQTALILLSADTGVSPNTFLISLFQSLATSSQQTITSRLISSFSTTCTAMDSNATRQPTQAAQWLNLVALLWTCAQTMEPALKTVHAFAIKASKALTALLRPWLSMINSTTIHETFMDLLGQLSRSRNLSGKSGSALCFRQISMSRKALTVTQTSSTTIWLYSASLKPFLAQGYPRPCARGTQWQSTNKRTTRAATNSLTTLLPWTNPAKSRKP